MSHRNTFPSNSCSPRPCVCSNSHLVSTPVVSPHEGVCPVDDSNDDHEDERARQPTNMGTGPPLYSPNQKHFIKSGKTVEKKNTQTTQHSSGNSQTTIIIAAPTDHVHKILVRYHRQVQPSAEHTQSLPRRGSESLHRTRDERLVHSEHALHLVSYLSLGPHAHGGRARRKLCTHRNSTNHNECFSTTLPVRLILSS